MQRKSKWPRDKAEDDAVLGIPGRKGKYGIGTVHGKAKHLRINEEKTLEIGRAHV